MALAYVPLPVSAQSSAMPVQVAAHATPVAGHHGSLENFASQTVVELVLAVGASEAEALVAFPVPDAKAEGCLAAVSSPGHFVR